MYKSDELELFPKNIEEIYAGLENDIMNDIIRRIAETGEITRTADWQLNRLYNMGADKTDIKKHIQEALNLSDTEIEQLYSDTLKEGYLRDESLYQAVGQEFIPFEENMALQQLIEATKQQTAKQLKNITRTMGFAVKQPNGRKTFKTVDNYFKDTMDNAVMHVLNGTFDYNSIIRKVTDEMTRSGVRSINYDSGISTRIDVAARRAILTGVNQVTSKISSDNMQKLDTEFVETSWHSTARPTHQVWQGRVFYWDRANPNADKIEAGVLYKSFIRETGYGEVDGLCGANCRHTFYPFIPGISVRTYTDEQLEELNRQENEKKEYNSKEYNKYEATQYQRRLETSMRKYRQDISLLKQSGLADDSDEVIAARCKYQTLSRKYSDFSKKMGLREHRDRINADGLKDIGKVNRKLFGANAIHNNERVYYNEKYDYSINLENYDEKINKGLSEAIEKVAKAGSEDGFEHMCLVNLRTGKLDYEETDGLPDAVGYKCWDFLDANPTERYAFVHNHITNCSLSEMDMRTVLREEQIHLMIAATNNAIKYVAERERFVEEQDFDKLYEKELKALSKKVRDGIISPAQRGFAREEIIVDNLIRDYTKKGELLIYDGKTK